MSAGGGLPVRKPVGGTQKPFGNTGILRPPICISIFPVALRRIIYYNKEKRREVRPWRDFPTPLPF